MATKKDRKTIRRDGVVSSVAEAHKIAELEACQRLLEGGLIGARIYSGPSVIGAFYSRQDKLLDEMKWVAVDVYEQRKLAIAHCQLVSGMVRKFWGERARGSLSATASMVQSYWLSVAREIRAPVPMALQSCGVFKLNTLQSIRPIGSPRSLSVPATPTGTSLLQSTLSNGLDDVGGKGHKKALSHGLVHDWLGEMESQAPPLAEGTMGLADFCVQIIKHNVREEHSGLHAPSHRESVSTESEQEDEQEWRENESMDDFMIPINIYMETDQSLADIETCRKLTLKALESGVQQNLSQNGLDGLRCLTRKSIQHCEFTSRALLSSTSLEAQRTVLSEIVATNIMSRSPQLFGLASNLYASVEQQQATKPRLDATSKKPQRSEDHNGSMVQHKHYFVSVIFSTFSPLPWEPVEDVFLMDAVKEAGGDFVVDWWLVASSVNWRMRTWLRYDLLRTAPQCSERFAELERIPTKKQSNGAVFVYSPIVRRKMPLGFKPLSSSSSSMSQQNSDVDIIVSDLDSSFNKEHAMNPTAALRVLPNSFERRGVYAVSKPPTNAFAKLFFHPDTRPCSVIARGASSSKRIPITHIFHTTNTHPSSFIVGKAKNIQNEPETPIYPNSSLVNNCRKSEIRLFLALKQKSIYASATNTDLPKRAFSLEDMIRKNSAAVPGYVPQYISGQLVCPVHPSFSNMTRIAEMTLNRLIGSVSESPTTHVPVPVPVDKLFTFCALFRSKYPAVFTSQHKVTKPSMPQLRPGLAPSQSGSKMVTRQQTGAHRQQQQAHFPQQTTHLPSQSAVSTPAEPAEMPGTSSNSNANWLQRSKRASAPASRSSTSPTIQSAPPPANPTAFMVAGGPSLYGQFGRSRPPGR